MTWILVALLAYALLGATLVAYNMREMQVSASPREWALLILLWPLMLRFFLQLAVLQAEMHGLERWGESRAKKR